MSSVSLRSVILLTMAQITVWSSSSQAETQSEFPVHFQDYMSATELVAPIQLYNDKESNEFTVHLTSGNKDYKGQLLFDAEGKARSTSGNFVSTYFEPISDRFPKGMDGGIQITTLDKWGLMSNDFQVPMQQVTAPNDHFAKVLRNQREIERFEGRLFAGSNALHVAKSKFLIAGSGRIDFWAREWRSGYSHWAPEPDIHTSFYSAVIRMNRDTYIRLQDDRIVYGMEQMNNKLFVAAGGSNVAKLHIIDRTSRGLNIKSKFYPDNSFSQLYSVNKFQYGKKRYLLLFGTSGPSIDQTKLWVKVVDEKGEIQFAKTFEDIEVENPVRFSAAVRFREGKSDIYLQLANQAQQGCRIYKFDESFEQKWFFDMPRGLGECKSMFIDETRPATNAELFVVAARGFQAIAYGKSLYTAELGRLKRFKGQNVRDTAIANARESGLLIATLDQSSSFQQRPVGRVHITELQLHDEDGDQIPDALDQCPDSQSGYVYRNSALLGCEPDTKP